VKDFGKNIIRMATVIFSALGHINFNLTKNFSQIVMIGISVGEGYRSSALRFLNPLNMFVKPKYQGLEISIDEYLDTNDRGCDVQPGKAYGMDDIPKSGFSFHRTGIWMLEKAESLAFRICHDWSGKFKFTSNSSIFFRWWSKA